MHNLVTHLLLFIVFYIVCTYDGKWMHHTHINKGKWFFSPFILSLTNWVLQILPLNKNLVLEIKEGLGKRWGKSM
jgi:hypothetical protein